ncbi:MAG: hypothetical protein LIO91_03475 [Bacteroidales bacterium]|nr:hypothetical protein [Bacteroidales bacterium]
MEINDIKTILGANIVEGDIERVKMLAEVASDRVSEESIVYGVQTILGEDVDGIKFMPDWLADIADGVKDFVTRYNTQVQYGEETRESLLKAEEERDANLRMWQRSDAKKRNVIALAKGLANFVNHTLDDYSI